MIIVIFTFNIISFKQEVTLINMIIKKTLLDEIKNKRYSYEFHFQI